MRTEHLSEIEIQQYVWDKANCETGIIEHIETCENCRAEAATYQLLFSAIKEQQKPAFDFDLAGLVLPQLSPAKPKPSMDIFLVCLLAFAVLGSIGIPVYLYREYFTKVFTGIFPMAMYLILITTVIILIFQGIEMYKKYQKQMDALNFH